MDKRRIGYLKWRSERVVSYLQRVGSLLVFAASFEILKINPLWFLILPVGFLALWFTDKFLLYPGESERSWKENPEWQSLLNRLDRMEEKIDGCLDRDNPVQEQGLCDSPYFYDPPEDPRSPI